MQLRKESLKKSGLPGFEPCDTGAALQPIELTSQLGAGH